MKGCYLLHFDPAYAAPTVTGGIKVARHYLGYSENVERRVEHHLAGRGGNPLVNAALKAGCRVQLVAVFHDWTRDDERAVKRAAHRERWCPRCIAAGLTRRRRPA